MLSLHGSVFISARLDDDGSCLLHCLNSDILVIHTAVPFHGSMHGKTGKHFFYLLNNFVLCVVSP